MLVKGSTEVHYNESKKQQISIGSGNGLASNWREAITWIKVEWGFLHHMVSLSLTEWIDQMHSDEGFLLVGWGVTQTENINVYISVYEKMEVFWVYFWMLKATYKQDSFDYDLYIPIGAVLSSCGGFLKILYWVAKEKF